MQIDPSANVDAFSKLTDKTDQVSAQVGVSLTKQVMDNTKDAVMELLGSMTPHLGQNVDLHL